MPKKTAKKTSKKKSKKKVVRKKSTSKKKAKKKGARKKAKKRTGKKTAKKKITKTNKYVGHFGNQFWKARSHHGRKPLWEDPQVLREACLEYIQWVQDNPLEEAMSYQGKLAKDTMPKMRAMTITGLCVFLGIVHDTWADYRTKPDFSVVTKEIEHILTTQKFEGAAAGFLNPNIIARDLGLKDKAELDHKSTDGSMTPHPTLTKEEALALLKKHDLAP